MGQRLRLFGFVGAIFFLTAASPCFSTVQRISTSGPPTQKDLGIRGWTDFSVFNRLGNVRFVSHSASNIVLEWDDETADGVTPLLLIDDRSGQIAIGVKYPSSIRLEMGGGKGISPIGQVNLTIHVPKSQLGHVKAVSFGGTLSYEGFPASTDRNLLFYGYYRPLSTSLGSLSVRPASSCADKLAASDPLAERAALFNFDESVLRELL